MLGDHFSVRPLTWDEAAYDADDRRPVRRRRPRRRPAGRHALKVLAVLQAAGTPRTRDQIAAALGWSPRQAARAVHAARREGAIVTAYQAHHVAFYTPTR